jgi:cold shock CspA family protein
MIGRVLDFDEDGGYGTLQAGDGTSYFFHCTAVADGSRTIAVGADVRFEVVPGRLGRWEGAEIEPLSSAG